MAPHVLRAASRRRLWELHKSFHCSIIGTCLSTSELRKVLSRVGIRTDDQSDHELHGQGVSLSSQSDSAGKLLNKLLDERHHLAVKKYSRARTEDDVCSLWLTDVKAGDIPGAYWATMTHSETSRGRRSATCTCFLIWLARRIGQTSGSFKNSKTKIHNFAKKSNGSRARSTKKLLGAIP